MALNNTKEHLKYVKAKLNQLKRTKGKEMAFTVLRLKGTREVVVHLDKAGTIARFKNPVAIHRILKKTSAFKLPAEDPFYADPSKLIAITGVATSDGSTVSFKKTRGRAGEKDLDVAMRFLKQKKDTHYVFGGEEQDTAEAEELSGMAARVAKLSALDPDAYTIMANRGKKFFSSVSDLGDVLAWLANKEDRSQVEKYLLENVRYAYRSLQAWGDEGVEPVSDALDILGGDEDFTEEEEMLAEAEEMTIKDVTAELAAIRERTRLLLSQKDFGGHLKSLLSEHKFVPSLRRGHFILTEKTTEAYGGEPLMIVSSSSVFHIEEEFDAVRAGRRLTGRFKRSKSGKKIAIIFGGRETLSRTQLISIFNKLSMSLDPYVVTDFDNLQTKLQAIKPLAAAEDLVEASVASGRLKGAGMDTVLADPDLLTAMVEMAKRSAFVENIAFLINARGLERPENLPAEHCVQTNSAQIFDDYIHPETSKFTINITSQQRKDLVATAEASGKDGLDYSACIREIRRVLQSGRYAPFLTSPELYAAVARSSGLQRRLAA